MTRTYLISRGSAAYDVGFSLVWFGLIVGFIIIGQLPHDWTPAHVAAVLAVLLFALFPALVIASIPYRITLTDDEECEFGSLLRDRRVRVHQIRAIDWDETDIYIVHDRGKIHLQADRGFEDFLVRLLELNPGIKADDGVRETLQPPV